MFFLNQFFFKLKNIEICCIRFKINKNLGKMSDQNTVKYHIGLAVTELFSEHISDWLKKNKKVEVTKEELFEACGYPMPTRPQPTMVRNPIPTAMPTYAGAPIPITPAKQQAKRTRRKATDDNKAKCEYEYQRGNNFGKTCGRPVAGENEPGGDRYCKACLKKGKVKEELNKGTFNKDIISKPKIKGEINVLPNDNKAERQVDVIHYKHRLDCFYNTETKYVLQTIDNAGAVVLGIDEQHDGQMRSLNKDEEDIAVSQGFTIASLANPEDTDIPQL